jgi:hypothetical protein
MIFEPFNLKEAKWMTLFSSRRLTQKFRMTCVHWRTR